MPLQLGSDWIQWFDQSTASSTTTYCKNGSGLPRKPVIFFWQMTWVFSPSNIQNYSFIKVEQRSSLHHQFSVFSFGSFFGCISILSVLLVSYNYNYDYYIEKKQTIIKIMRNEDILCNRFDLYYWCEHLSYMNDSFIPRNPPKIPHELYPRNQKLWGFVEAWASSLKKLSLRMPIFFTFVECGNPTKKEVNDFFFLAKLSLLLHQGHDLFHWNFFLHLHSFDYSDKNQKATPPTVRTKTAHTELKNTTKNHSSNRNSLERKPTVRK